MYTLFMCVHTHIHNTPTLTRLTWVRTRHTHTLSHTRMYANIRAYIHTYIYIYKVEEVEEMMSGVRS